MPGIALRWSSQMIASPPALWIVPPADWIALCTASSFDSSNSETVS